VALFRLRPAFSANTSQDSFLFGDSLRLEVHFGQNISIPALMLIDQRLICKLHLELIELQKMNIKRDNFMRTVFALLVCLLTAESFFYAAETSSMVASSDLDYFKGNWVITMRDNPQTLFHWNVKEDLRGSWMAGVVERNGEKVSTDFWRQIANKIERFAFTSDGTFVKIESPGWTSNKLVFEGVASDKNGEARIRETITRVNDREFQALWERMSGGKWIVFADELCRRQ
jgi:hypothetical protein